MATLTAAIPLQAGTVHSATISVFGEIGLNSFAFYPKRFGLLGTIEVDGSADKAALSVLLPGAYQQDVTGAASLPLLPAQVILKLSAAGGGVLFPTEGLNASASLSYRFDIDPSVTRRLHWAGKDVDDRAVDSVANWVENLMPDAHTLAVFGKTPYTQQPRITQSLDWGGIIVDGGNEAAFDLEGHTLHLGRSAVLEDEFSVLVGEERFGNSSLYFSNGVVEADSNVLVQARTTGDAGGTSAAFGVSAGAHLKAPGLTLGASGGGAAFVENGG